ncbi:MAG: PQQ-binding-like beta-propeller repeat protein [Candidatus Zixiibacteriota bacterium]|nr:MAG: PQQ-binding-like beta-propeller repeat protein [candidate division Zixibacteria bacterium]
MSRARYIIAALSALLLLTAGCSRRYRADSEMLGVESAWPYHRGGLSSLGALTDGGFSGRLDLLWEFQSNDKPVGPLTIQHDHLVYPGARNKIKFLDAVTGKYLGYIKPRGTPQTGLIVADSLAIFAVSPRHSRLSCYHVTSGKELWRRRVGDASPGLIVVDDRLVVGASDGVLLALEPQTGNLIWHFRGDCRFLAPASSAAGKVLQPGDNGYLYALSVRDGRELFRSRLDGPLVNPVAVAERIYATDASGMVYCLDTSKGDIIWQTQLKGPVWTSPAVADGRVFVGHSAGELVALDAALGHILWKFDAVDVIKASAVVAGKYVVVATMTGKLYSLEAASGQVVAEREIDGAISTAPVTDGERVYVASDKGLIACFGLTLPADESDPH